MKPPIFIAFTIAVGRAIAKQGGNDAKFQRRVETINLVLSAHSATELSRNMGCHANTIIRWVKTADERGFEALHDRKKPGRLSRLSTEQHKEIDCALQEDPAKYHYNGGREDQRFVAQEGKAFDLGRPVAGVRQHPRKSQILGYSTLLSRF